MGPETNLKLDAKVDVKLDTGENPELDIKANLGWSLNGFAELDMEVNPKLNPKRPY